MEVKPGLDISTMPSLLQALCRHKILVTFASSVYAHRAGELNSAKEVNKVQELFDKVDTASRNFDISSEDDVKDLLLLRRAVNLQCARAK